MNVRKLFMRTRQLALLSVLGCSLGHGTPSDAQEASVDPLSLNDCVRIALAHHPLLKASIEEQIAAREAVGEARSSYYPTLGVRGGVSRWQNHAFLPSGFSAPDLSSTIGPTDDWSAGAFARYMLYDSGVRRSELDRAKAAEAIDIENGESTRLNVLYEVHLTFYQFASALELKTVARKSLANAESHFNAATDRQLVGDTTEADVLRARVEVDNAKAELIRAQSSIYIAAGALNMAMGLPAEQPIAINARATQGVDTNETPITEWIELALEHRPEIKAMQSTVEATQYQMEGARAAFGPKIYAEGSYGWRDDDSSLNDEAWSIGVAVELSLFEGYSKRHQLNRARAETAKADAVLERIKQGVRKDVWNAYAQVQEASELIHATSTQAQHAEESLRLMAARYKVGSAPLTDLLDAQTALTAAEVRHVQARWGTQQAQATLRRATGLLAAEE